MNVLFVVMDTLRADHLGCYGYFRGTSPVMDRLAEEGVLFEDFYASGVPTGPGFTSLVTGMFPVNHRFYLTPHNFPDSYQVDDNIVTLAEVMWENGYVTAALDNLVNFRSHMKHFTRGYEYHINVTGTARWLHHHITADMVNRRLLPWIRAHSDERFFLFVHYWDPHTPYNQPKEYQNLFHHERGNLSDLKVREAPAGYQYVPGWGKADQIFEGDEQVWRSPIPGETFARGRSIDLYDGEVAYVDNRLGQVIDALRDEGILEDTLVVVTSDHGEQLGQHGLYGHTGLHDANVYLPLIMRYPKKLPRGRRVRGFAQHADVASTIFELAEVPLEETLAGLRGFAESSPGPSDIRGFTDGRSLLPLVGGRRVREEVFVETTSPQLRRKVDRVTVMLAGQRAVRTGEWKYIRHMEEGGAELYNVKADPMEVINLAEEERDTARRLEEKLTEWVRSNLGGEARDPILRPPA